MPAERVRYLAEIAQAVRDYHAHIEAQTRAARERQSLRTARSLFEAAGKASPDFEELIASKAAELTSASAKLLEQWPKTRELYGQDEYVVRIRDKEIRTQLKHESLSGTKVPKVALPRFHDEGEILRFLMKENVPGSFPFTAGVFAFKREGEDPTRMFAGEGDAFRTNQRFKRLSEGMPAQRLSTAFDSVTLYGSDPDPRPDIYGKVGNSGVSIATLDDMQALYAGFDLCAPTHIGIHDHQRSGADHSGHVHEHRDRSATRQVSRAKRAARPPRMSGRRSRRGRCRPCAARCRPIS